MHRHAAPPVLPGLVHSEQFADGPPRWYARRGALVVTGTSRIDVVAQLWDQDAAWLGITEVTPPRVAAFD